MLFQCLECIIVQLSPILHFVYFSIPPLRLACTHDWGLAGCIRCNPMAFLDQYEEGATMSKNMNRLNDDPCC